MKGKADMLVAHRTLSALVVVCLVISAFAGLLFLGNPAPTRAQGAIGDLTVTGDYVIDGILQPVDGNVTVQSGGTLTVQDGTLSIISNYATTQRHTVTVQAGGTLVLNHGTITTYLDQITPWPFLDLIVSGGTLEASGDSILMFPGHITLTGGAQVTLSDTEIRALPESDVVQFVVGSMGTITEDAANDGPSISMTDSTLRLFDSSVTDLPEFPNDHALATNITLAGDSVLLAANSYIGVDFGPVRGGSDYYVHNAMKLTGVARAELYGCSFEPYAGIEADRAPAIEANGQTYVAIPASRGGEDTTGQTIEQIQQSGDGSSYHVAPGTLMAIDSFSAGPVRPIDGATLIVRYLVNPGYNGDRYVTWSTNEGGTTTSTGIRPMPTETSYVEKSYDLYAAGVTTIGALTTLDVNFQHSGTIGDVQFDSLAIVISIGPEAHIYRWLNVTVGDEYGVPIPDADVSAVFTGSQEYGGQPSFYFGEDGSVQALPPSTVLTYMGANASTFGLTEDDGIAHVPFLTDLVSGGQSPNSLYIGSFDLTGAAVIPGKGPCSSTEAFSFPAYPAMDLSDTQADTTVEIQGVSAWSPDSSKWLVVPVDASTPSLTIADMTYYHAGDVIVAANGTLTFDNAVFELVQSHDNERTVYVDGTDAAPATLIFEKSVMTSQKKIDIIVKGDATLEVLNSTLLGVNIVALERSHVYFRNANMTGSISTAWNSEATIDIRDSILDTAPILSGSSSGSFTNCSVPSITVQDDATAYIYRWIHVTVLDGAGKPMPGVTVTARTYVGGIVMGSAVTSSQSGQLGVAKVNSLGTKITSAGSTFVGNYKVNASITWGARNWWADEVSVGVMPYTEPLGKNATYATMTIDEAFPDLTMLAGSVDTNRTYPMKGQSTMVTANVTNVGMSAAYAVAVEFYDVSDQAPYSPGAAFAVVTLPMILAGQTVQAQAVWTPGLPVFPYNHTLTVVVDRLNSVAELSETEARGECQIRVMSLPDLELREGANEIFTSPSYVVIGNSVYINAYIHNVGDNDSQPFSVEFRDGTTQIAVYAIDTLAAGASRLISFPHTFATTGLHVLDVYANTTFLELSTGNNRVTKDIYVLNHPDLSLSGIQFYSAKNELVSSIPGGNMVKVSAWLRNINPAPFSNPQIVLYATYAADPNYLATTTATISGVFTSSTSATMVTLSFTAPDQYPGTIVLNIRMIVNEAQSPTESDYTNNEVSSDLTVLDVRADLAVSESDIKVQHTNLPGNITSEMFGRQVKVIVTVHNAGGREASFALDIRTRNTGGYNTTMKYTTANVSRNATDNFVKVTYLWTINLTTPGPYQIYVAVDPGNAIQEPNEDNNIAWTNFSVQTLLWQLTVTTDDTEYKAGDTLLVTVTISYEGDGLPVKNLPGVQLWLVDPNNDAVNIEGSSSPVLKTDDTGSIAIAEMLAPTSLHTGMYKIRVVVTDAGSHDAETQVHVSESVSGGLFPWWVWLIIGVSVIGVVAGFTVYTYVYGLGKLVECGECGAFIPAASKRCPKCGVEFEVGTMKCSECGAWIPAESAECPNCGVKFVGETEDEADYLERMRKEYDDMVSKYREIAKGDLGKKFTDRDFEAWWRRQPAYISFDDWLAKEEEKKKGGPVPCPVCGTLNPKEATVCHKCGTVFGAAQVQKKPPQGGAGVGGVTPVQPQRVEQQPVQPQEPMQQAQQPAAPRMVIRRPIDRKVVPKKIIKTPVSGEETQEGTQNGDDQQQ